MHDGKRVLAYPNARRPDWPDADYIVGNPPFIGGKDIRAALGDDETKALWRVHPHINESADFVMSLGGTAPPKAWRRATRSALGS